jgi:hypothetical protein
VLVQIFSSEPPDLFYHFEEQKKSPSRLNRREGLSSF